MVNYHDRVLSFRQNASWNVFIFSLSLQSFIWNVLCREMKIFFAQFCLNNRQCGIIVEVQAFLVIRIVQVIAFLISGFIKTTFIFLQVKQMSTVLFQNDTFFIDKSNGCLFAFSFGFWQSSIWFFLKFTPAYLSSTRTHISQIFMFSYRWSLFDWNNFFFLKFLFQFTFLSWSWIDFYSRQLLIG